MFSLLDVYITIHHLTFIFLHHHNIALKKSLSNFMENFIFFLFRVTTLNYLLADKKLHKIAFLRKAKDLRSIHKVL